MKKIWITIILITFIITFAVSCAPQTPPEPVTTESTTPTIEEDAVPTQSVEQESKSDQLPMEMDFGDFKISLDGNQFEETYYDSGFASRLDIRIQFDASMSEDDINSILYDRLTGYYSITNSKSSLNLSAEFGYPTEITAPESAGYRVAENNTSVVYRNFLVQDTAENSIENSIVIISFSATDESGEVIKYTFETSVTEDNTLFLDGTESMIPVFVRGGEDAIAYGFQKDSDMDVDVMSFYFNDSDASSSDAEQAPAISNDNNSSADTAESATETTSQRNAVRMAKDYLDYTAFSREGLIGQLEYEGFSNEDATYGADNCGADWMEQAVKCAENYLDYTAFSRQGLIDQLEYEGFTHEQAVHGVDAVGL